MTETDAEERGGSPVSSNPTQKRVRGGGSEFLRYVILVLLGATLALASSYLMRKFGF